MVVTIDGPAGAGKSSVARALAERLGFQFLDTGAMYRAVTWQALRCGVAVDDREAIGRLARDLPLTLAGGRVLLGGEDISDQIRTATLAAQVCPVADNDQVRLHLIDLQRRLAEQGDTVTEGRDQGTLAFPEAACKLFLTASPRERARRRLAELRAREGDTSLTLDQVLEQQDRRDRADALRPLGALKPAPDAILVNTDGLTLVQVVDRLEQIVRTRLSELHR